MSDALTSPARRPWRYVETAWVTTCLSLFLLLAIHSAVSKSPVTDEAVHFIPGYCYWELNDYRFNPENGNLPQRWAALPLAFGWTTGGETIPVDYTRDSMWRLCEKILYEDLPDPEFQLLVARSMIALLGVGLLGLAYAWSRAIWGPAGACFTLTLACFSPNLIAHGRLITSDMAQTLTYLGACWALWYCFARPNWKRATLAGLAVGLACVSKFSAVLLAPIALGFWIYHSRSGPAAPSRKRWAQGLTALLAIGVLAYGMIWAFYGFRYSAFNPELPQTSFYKSWNEVLDPETGTGRAIERMREYRVFPEPFLYGTAHILAHADGRESFLLGKSYKGGVWYFFPIAVFLKTPVPVLIALAWLLARVLGRARRQGLGNCVNALLGRHDTLVPLLAGAGAYWLMGMASNMNIGVRHLLVTFPTFYILAGGCLAGVNRRKARQRWLPLMLALALVAWQAYESLRAFPHYLAYFNQIGGGSCQGYHYLVDSSLDWGQDLPAVQEWIDAQRQMEPDVPIYLNYASRAKFNHYNVAATQLHLHPDHQGPMRIAPLEPGLYLISATHYQGLYGGVSKPWTLGHEQLYRDHLQWISHLAELESQPGGAAEAFRREGAVTWIERLTHFNRLRNERLRETLAGREPDDIIANTVLVFRLNEKDLAEGVVDPSVGFPLEGNLVIR